MGSFATYTFVRGPFVFDEIRLNVPKCTQRNSQIHLFIFDDFYIKGTPEFFFDEKTNPRIRRTHAGTL